MIYVMGGLLVALSFLKLADWQGFAHAFSEYDLIAKKSKVYAFIYPLIELGLGVSYLMMYEIKVMAAITLVIMVIGAIGVTINLFSPRRVQCACLGTLIKVPLTKFTLVEDVVMAGMALMILLV